MQQRHAGAHLTPIGQQIYQQAQAVLDQLEGIRQTANQAKDLHTGRVRVATVRTVATHVLPAVIAQFQQIYPDMSVEVIERDRYVEVEQALRDAQAELGITLMPVSAEFQAWELFRDEFVALLPPTSLAGTDLDLPLTWETLISYPRIANSRSSQHNRLIDEHIVQFGYQPPTNPDMRINVREDSTLMGMVAKGLGIAVLSRLEAEPIPPGVRVKSLPDPLERIVGAAILDRAVLPRAAFVFLDVLRSHPVSRQQSPPAPKP